MALFHKHGGGPWSALGPYSVEPSLIDACVDAMLKEMHSIIVDPSTLWLLPSVWMVQHVRQRWHQRGGIGKVPLMATYHHPLRYTVSARYAKTPISMAKSLALTINFLHHHQHDQDIVLDLPGLAYDMIHVWESAEQHRWSNWETSLAGASDTITNPNGPTTSVWPGGNTTNLWKTCTLRLVEQWWSWWPQWLNEHGYSSQAEASALGRKMLAPNIQRGQHVAMIIVPSLSLPLGWIQQWHMCSNVSFIADTENKSFDPLNHLLGMKALPSHACSGPLKIPCESVLDLAPCDVLCEANMISPSPHIQHTQCPPPLSGVLNADNLSSPNTKKDSACVTQSLFVGTQWEQSRMIALLVHHALTTHPDDRVGLMIHSSQLLSMTASVLKGYGWSIALPQHPLIAGLFQAVWRAVVWHHQPQNDGGAWLWDVLSHPLICKTYPLVRLIERWIRRWNVWPTLDDKAPCSVHRPKWMRKVEDKMRHVWNLWSPFFEDSKQGYSLDLWLKAHLESVAVLVPHTLWDHPNWLAMLVDEMMSPHHPEMKAEQYALWMQTWFSTIYRQPEHRLTNPRIILGTSQDLSSLRLQHVIVGIEETPPQYAWLPRWCLDNLGIVPETTRDLPYLAPGGTVWQVSVDGCSLPSSSPWNDRAERLFQTSPSVSMVVTNPTTAPSIHHLTISDVQRWRQDPQRFYDESLLKIRSSEVSHQQMWGMAIHTVMEHFIRACPVTDVYTVSDFVDVLHELAKVYLPPVLWWQEPMLKDMWRQAADIECSMREHMLVEVLTEFSGGCHLPSPPGLSCRLWGRADRLNIYADGTADLIDYKTGALPSFVAMERFESVQLPLEAWLIAKGGMACGKDGTARAVSGLAWWSFHVRKGSSLKRYPRSVPLLVDKYDAILPVWTEQWTRGTYMQHQDEGGL